MLSVVNLSTKNETGLKGAYNGIKMRSNVINNDFRNNFIRNITKLGQLDEIEL